MNFCVGCELGLRPRATNPTSASATTARRVFTLITSRPSDGSNIVNGALKSNHEDAKKIVEAFSRLRVNAHLSDNGSRVSVSRRTSRFDAERRGGRPDALLNHIPIGRQRAGRDPVSGRASVRALFDRAGSAVARRAIHRRPYRSRPRRLGRCRGQLAA